MENRVYVILNGKRDLSKVAENLKQLFNDGNTVLLYTKSELSEVKSVFEEKLEISQESFDAVATYVKFNEYNADDFKDGKSKKIVVVKMPQSLFKSIPHALNSIIKFATSTGIGRFVHFFYDDLKIPTGKTYDPSAYEWYMDMFNEPFVLDAKLNRANFSFKKLSPRFIFVSKELKSPVSFYQFEGKDHFIIDVEHFSSNFDEKLKRLYMIEYIIRAHSEGFVKHMTFYPDPVLEETVVRDTEIPSAVATEDIMKEYQSDDVYIRETLKLSIKAESSVDPIINYMTGIIRKNEKPFEKTEMDSKAEVVVPEVV